MDNKTQELLANKFTKRFEEYNTKVLEELADVIKQFDGLTYTQAYKLAQQLKYNKDYVDLIDELSKLTGKSKKELEKLLEEVVNQHIEFSDTFFKAKNMKTPIYQNDKVLKEMVSGVVNVVGTEFTNLARSTGFTFLDKDNHILFLNMKDTYYKVIDECIYAVSQGKDTYQNVMRKTINQLVDSGVRKIVYKNDGKRQYTERIDSAVKRNILDGIRQISNETELEFGKRFKADGVEISVHSEPAPDHMYVQGHQFYNDEFKKFQNDTDCKDVNGVEYPATSEETGRDRRSIGQYNCYHSIFSIIVGISRPLYTDEQLQQIIDKTNEKIEIDGKEYTRYEATQLQRRIETEIRKNKDAQIMYRKDDDREMAEKHQLNITRLTRKYKEISKKANLLEAPSKMRVSGYRPIKVKEKEIINSKDIAIHFGDLGKARDTNYFSISSGRRSTGHFGDGTYFVSKEEANRLNNSTYFSRNDRPQKEVDFSQYNLYKPLIEPEGMRLHEGLKAINYGEYDDYNFRFMKDDLIRNGISEDKINKAIKIVEEKRKEFEKGDFEYQLKQDSLSTIFMKELGYNGIDVRGLENLDNMSYGSVIYDLKKKKK